MRLDKVAMSWAGEPQTQICQQILTVLDSELILRNIWDASS